MKTLSSVWVAVSMLASVAIAGESVVLGPTYEIVEPDTLEEIRTRAAKVNWAAEMNKKDPADYSAFRGAPLPIASKYEERFFDPTYVLPYDLRDADGKLLHPQGTRVNVYERLTLPGRYIVIDGSPTHLKWLEEVARPTSGDRILVANGSVYGLRARKDHTFYVLDPRGIERFGLKAVPSIVEQVGTQLKITEFVVAGSPHRAPLAANTKAP